MCPDQGCCHRWRVAKRVIERTRNVVKTAVPSSGIGAMRGPSRTALWITSRAYQRVMAAPTRGITRMTSVPSNVRAARAIRRA